MPKGARGGRGGVGGDFEIRNAEIGKWRVGRLECGKVVLGFECIDRLTKLTTSRMHGTSKARGWSALPSVVV